MSNEVASNARVTDAVMEAAYAGWASKAGYSPMEKLRAAIEHAFAAIEPCEPIAWLCDDLIIPSSSVITDRAHAEARMRNPDAWKVTPLYPRSAIEPAQEPQGRWIGSGCATEGCDNLASVYFERGGVGTSYCRDCYVKVQALRTNGGDSK